MWALYIWNKNGKQEIYHRERDNFAAWIATARQLMSTGHYTHWALMLIPTGRILAQSKVV